MPVELPDDLVVARRGIKKRDIRPVGDRGAAGVHRIGVPIRARTELQATIAQEVIASTENLLGTCNGILTCGGEARSTTLTRSGSSCALTGNTDDRLMKWRPSARCAAPKSSPSSALRLAGPAGHCHLPRQGGDERRSPPHRSECRSAQASFELSGFTQRPEAKFLGRHRHEPVEDLSRHTGRALGSERAPRGVAMLSYRASHRDRTTVHWYSAQLSRAAAVSRSARAGFARRRSMPSAAAW